MVGLNGEGAFTRSGLMVGMAMMVPWVSLGTSELGHTPRSGAPLLWM